MLLKLFIIGRLIGAFGFRLRWRGLSWSLPRTLLSICRIVYNLPFLLIGEILAELLVARSEQRTNRSVYKTKPVQTITVQIGELLQSENI